jgi:putative membrane protein
MKKTIKAAVLAALAVAIFPLAAEGAKVTKEETVYAVLAPEGTVKSVIVSDWLHSPKSGALVRDRSSLTGIVNVDGDERPAVSGQSVSWQMSGQDIYYQGKSQAAPPLDFTVSYWLDGRKVPAADLSGKSGKLKIVISAVNREQRAMVVKGQSRTVALPFVAAVLLNLPSSIFSDVEISSNAVALGDGQSRLVLGALLPGLDKSLSAFPEMKDAVEKLGAGGLSIPDSMTITATVASFSMGSIYITATPDLASILAAASSGKKAKGLDAADLSKTMNAFSASGNKLEKGVANLADGSDKLRDGIDSLYDALASKLGSSGDSPSLLDSALGLLNDDAKLQSARRLLADAEYLNGLNLDAIKPLASSLDSKTMGLLKKTLDDSRGLDLGALTDMPLAGLLITDENVKNLAGGLAESNAFYSRVKADDLKEAYRLAFAADALGKDAALAAALGRLNDGPRRDAVLTQLKSSGLSAADLESVESLVCAAPELAAAQAFFDPDNVAFLNGVLEGLSRQKELHAKNKATYQIAESVLKLAAKNGGIKKTIKKLEALQGDLKEMGPALASLQGKIEGGALDGLGDPAALAKKLVSMTDDLKASIDMVKMADSALTPENVGAAKELAAKLPELKSGVVQLHEGANKLADGMATLRSQVATFNEQGIQPLSAKLGGLAGVLGGVQEYSEKLLELSRGYSTFSGIGEGMEGKVKFIMRTEEIK